VTLTLKEIIGSRGRNTVGMAQDVGHEFLGRKRAAPNYDQRSIGLPEKGVLLGVRAGIGWLVNCSGLNDPVAALAGHGSNEIEVSVVVEQREVVCFCGGSDKEVWDLSSALAALGE
jgi:hypothetical protein